jgi:hypothetical protein
MVEKSARLNAKTFSKINVKDISGSSEESVILRLTETALNEFKTNGKVIQDWIRLRPIKRPSKITG